MSDEPLPEPVEPAQNQPEATDNPVADRADGRFGLAALSGHHLSASTTRWALAAVAAGAVVAAAITLSFTGFENHSELQAHQPGSAPVTGAVAGAAFGSAQPGSCLTWSKADATDLSKVDCSAKHLFEVAADIDLSKYPGVEFGPGSKFPGQIRLKELNVENCEPAVQSYLGGRFDPRGKFIVGMVNPGEAGWAAGERTVRCGLQNSTANSGALRPIVGTVASQDQSNVLEPGLCIGINQNLPTDPVDCKQPHAFEVVGMVDLAPAFQDAPPSQDQQDKFMTPACQKASADYLGTPDGLRNKTLTPFFDRIDPDSWLGGSRKLNCWIGKGNNDGFAPIVGSAKGDILIDGQPPVPPPALPNGRSMSPPLPGASAPR